jgi:hypothetical protein
MSATIATIHLLSGANSCARKCGFTGATKAHHDRLVRIDQDLEDVLDLMELAVTWGELDYSQESVIGPDHWLDFAQTHTWQDPERAERVLSLATDVAMGSMRVGRTTVVRTNQKGAVAR